MTNEFKKVKTNSETRYVLETATAGATSAGVVATAPGKKREDSILAQEAGKEKDAPKPRNFVAKNAKMGGAGKMKDKSKTIPRKEKHKKAVAEGFNGEYDDEAGMAKSNLLTSARAVMGLLKTIKNRDNLPEWGQEKIAKAEMMLVSVWDYLQSQKEMGIDPQQDANESRYDRRDAYQRDYDSSVSGMGRGPDHRGLGQELAHERNNYAVTIDGRTWKVFADQRQAQNIARSLQAKGKKAAVSVTGADPTESVAEGERTMSRAAKGHEKYGKAGMAALAKAGRDGAGEEKLDAIRDKHDKYNEGVAEGSLNEGKGLAGELAGFLKANGFKGPYRLGKLPKWAAELSEFDKNSVIMVQGNDVEYDEFVVDIGYGQLYWGAEGGMTKMTEKAIMNHVQQGVAEVAGPEKCWPGHRKVGTKPGTGKNAGKRVNDCEKIGEEEVAEVAPPGWEKTVKAMKKHDNIDNPFALAWSMKNKGYKSHKKESVDPYFESLRAKVEELAKK